MPYPIRQQSPNGFQVSGQALTQAAGQVNDFQDRQAKARALMEEMVANRQKRALEELQAQQQMQAQAAENERKQAEEDRKADEAKRAAAFRDKVAGQVISKTLANDPTLSRSSKPLTPGGPTQAELDDPGNVQGMTLPNQDVSGQDSTAMMGSALDRMAGQGDMANGRTPMTREEITRAGLETGQLAPKDYLEQTKPGKEGVDPALTARYYSEFLPKIGPLLKRLKNDPTIASDIAYLGEQEGLGPVPEYQKFIDNLKGGQPWNAATGQRLQLAGQGQTFQQENALRDEYNTKTKPFETAFNAYKKLSQALERNNPTDSYSAIINYVRTLDPGSTVREAEERLARERSSGGPLGTFGQYLSNLKDGQLTDEVRKNLLEAGRGLVGSEYDTYQQVRKDYGNRVKSYNDRGYGLNENAVLGNDYTPSYQEEVSRDIFKPQKVVAAQHPKAEQARKLATAVLSNSKATPEQKAKAEEVLRRLNAQPN
jgi:hypothetical protein